MSSHLTSFICSLTHCYLKLHPLCVHPVHRLRLPQHKSCLRKTHQPDELCLAQGRFHVWLNGRLQFTVAKSNATGLLYSAIVLKMPTSGCLKGFNLEYIFVPAWFVYVHAMLSMWHRIRAFWCTKHSKGNWQHWITIATPSMWDASATYSTVTKSHGLTAPPDGLQSAWQSMQGVQAKVDIQLVKQISFSV